MGKTLDAMRRAASKGTKAAKAAPPPQKPRLPNGSYFAGMYTSTGVETGYWEVTLHIGEHTFAIQRNGIFAALSALDKQYRAHLKKSAKLSACPLV